MTHSSYSNTIVFTIITVLAGVIMWILPLTSDYDSDTVSLYTVSRPMPSLGAMTSARDELGTAASKTAIATKLQTNLLAHCNMLDNPPSTLTTIGTPDISNLAAVLANALAGINFGTTPPPWCQCAKKVLSIYKALTNKTFEDTDKAFRACLATQQHIPKYVPMWTERVDQENIVTRKQLSRRGTLLMICLAHLFNFVYGWLDFKPSVSYWSNNMITLILLVLTLLAMWLLPMVYTKSSGNSPIVNLFAMTSIIMVPAVLVEFILIEIVWASIYHYKRKTAFIHPFTFYITLAGLSVLALVENGVFTFEIIMTHILSCHVIALAYAAVLFFLHYSCGDWTQEGDGEKMWINNSDYTDIPEDADEQSLLGYFIIFSTVSLLSVANLIPVYPFACEWNILWLLPILFTGLSFGTAVFVEHLVPRKDAEKLEYTSHVCSLGHFIIILIVILYYLMQQQFLTYGDSVMPNIGIFRKSVNYAFTSNPRTPTEMLIGR